MCKLCTCGCFCTGYSSNKVLGLYMGARGRKLFCQPHMQIRFEGKRKGVIAVGKCLPALFIQWNVVYISNLHTVGIKLKVWFMTTSGRSWCPEESGDGDCGVQQWALHKLEHQYLSKKEHCMPGHWYKLCWQQVLFVSHLCNRQETWCSRKWLFS